MTETEKQDGELEARREHRMWDACLYLLEHWLEREIIVARRVGDNYVMLYELEEYACKLMQDDFICMSHEFIEWVRSGRPHLTRFGVEAVRVRLEWIKQEREKHRLTSLGANTNATSN